MATFNKHMICFVRALVAVVVISSFSLVVHSQDSQAGLTQADLDHFAKKLQVNFTVIENSYFNKKLYESEILLTNKGDRTFPPYGWEIVFSQPYVLEPNSLPNPQGVEKPKYGVRFHSLVGNVYSMVPTRHFGGIRPGKNKFIRFISEHSNVATTDTHPNWYIAGPGLEPRILESTRGESLDFVSPHDTPATWKANTMDGDKDFDHHNPYSAADRYHKMNVEDMKSAPNLVIPTPVSINSYNRDAFVNVRLEEGEKKWVIVTSQRLANEANYLAEQWNLQVTLQRPNSYFINFVEANISVTANGRQLPLDEAYELSVDPSSYSVTIMAARPAGAFYAIQTLFSLEDNEGNIPQAVVRDAPRYRYRGVLLDVARNFQSKEKIYRYLDVMAMYKLNKFHFHLTDDEGWRLAIPGLEELTQIGAMRCHDKSETKCLLPFLGAGPFPGPSGSGFYTVEDYRSILRYATQRHIEVIPEIDMPGHSHAAIKAMEARYTRMLAQNVTEASRFLLSDLEDASDYMSIQGFSDGAVNPCLRSTYAFVSRVLNSLYAMHRDISPLRAFNFGGDEVPAGTWEKSPVCDRLRQGGMVSDMKEYFATQISNLTSLYDLDLMAWEDGVMKAGQPIARSKFPNRNVYVYAWNNVWEWGGYKRAYDFANNGFKVILTPSTHLYLDHAYEPDPEERGLYWAARYIDTKKVYTFMPENLYRNADTYRNGKNITICRGKDVEKMCPTLRNAENIEGIQGSLFGELLRTQWEADYMLLPRMLALAERAWHEAAWESDPSKIRMKRAMEKDWVQFANTLGYKELERLDRLGYKYRIPPPGAIVVNNILTTSVTFPGLNVQLSEDEGKTWTWVESGTTEVNPSKDYLLRTSAKFGSRFSREISLFEEFNAAPSSPPATWLVLGVNFTVLANMLRML